MEHLSERSRPGYNPDACNIPNNVLWAWFGNIPTAEAIKHAQELKNKNIKIYIIGLGSVNKPFLAQVASGPQFEYYAPTSSELQALFNLIAKDIKLRLVQ